MLEAVFELFVPLVVARIIDKGIGDGNRTVIVRCCIVMIILGLVGLISAVSAQYMAARAAVGFSTGLRHDLFRHIMSLSHKNIDELGTSTMITRMTADINQTQTGVNMFLRLFLRSPFIVFGAMIMAFTINVRAALIFVVVIVILFATYGRTVSPVSASTSHVVNGGKSATACFPLRRSNFLSPPSFV